MCCGGVSRRGLGVFDDLAGLVCACGIGVGVLIGDPGEQLGLVG
jgi:hypothetical protein